MKKLMNKFNFALVAVMVATPAFADNPMCDLVKRLGHIFGWIRNLAFVGAAFIIAAWAWDFIAKGEVKMDDVKKKGMGMFVGFLLLFSIGILINFLLGAADVGGSFQCPDAFNDWGTIVQDS
ncbi:MAG: hypothetical protein J6R22_04815 [Alphaproteobacteria bacterium]|nr:hypothetical protein [Alphaproteobacteria bacterium]